MNIAFHLTALLSWLQCSHGSSISGGNCGIEQEFILTSRLGSVDDIKPCTVVLDKISYQAVYVKHIKETVLAWSKFSPWSDCTKSCDGGTKHRARKCELNGVQVEDDKCQGLAAFTMACNTAQCAAWSVWSPWNTCSVSCGTGTTTRSRICEGLGTCSEGDNQEQTTCDTGTVCAGWSAWSHWDTCSASCGSGTTSRTRTCAGIGTCPGEAQEQIVCDAGAACLAWDEWTEWSVCTPSACSEGTWSRSRTCTGAAEDCPGDAAENANCDPPLLTCSCPGTSTCRVPGASWFEQDLIIYVMGFNGKEEGYIGNSLSPKPFIYYDNHPAKYVEHHWFNEGEQTCGSHILGHYHIDVPAQTISSFTYMFWLSSSVPGTFAEYLPIGELNRGVSWDHGFTIISGGPNGASDGYKLGLQMHGGQITHADSPVLKDQEWMHVGITYDSTTGQVTFYVNGSQSGSAVQGGSGFSSSSLTHFWPLNGAFGGTPDNINWAGIELYSRVLSGSSIEAAYNRNLSANC